MILKSKHLTHVTIDHFNLNNRNPQLTVNVALTTYKHKYGLNTNVDMLNRLDYINGTWDWELLFWDTTIRDDIYTQTNEIKKTTYKIYEC